MAAHSESFGIVLMRPNSRTRRKSNPGAKRSTFIFTDTAKLSEREEDWVEISERRSHWNFSQRNVEYEHS